MKETKTRCKRRAVKKKKNKPFFFSFFGSLRQNLNGERGYKELGRRCRNRERQAEGKRWTEMKKKKKKKKKE